MVVRFDFRDVDAQLAGARDKVKQVFSSEGASAVEDAKQSGNYTNRTGRLRSSNRYEASSDKIALINDAEYASNVEAKGYEVLSGAFLRMIKRIEDNDNNK